MANKQYEFNTNGGPIFLNFVTIKSRFDSFKDWGFDSIQDPNTLAKAGFFHCGTADRVFCFYCGVALWKWSRYDNPWIEHALNKPKCAYLLINRNSNEVIVNVSNFKMYYITILKYLFNIILFIYIYVITLFSFLLFYFLSDRRACNSNSRRYNFNS